MPMFASTESMSLLAARDAATFSCSTDRASDYFGLGVRLGVYFAWLQSYLANTVLTSEIGTALDTNTIFLLTLFIAMANDSRTGDLTRLDGLVLMHLCAGSLFGVLSLWGYRTRAYTQYGPAAIGFFGSFGTHIRLALSLAISVFGMWFWSFGVKGELKTLGPGDGQEEANGPECEPLYTFFFAKVVADGGIRFYYRVVCTCCIAYFGAQFVVSMISGLYSFKKLLGLTSWRDTNQMRRPTYATGFKYGELTLIHKVLRAGNLAWLLLSAATVECTLNFNNVNLVLAETKDHLHQPGQLLPFLVGTFGFVRICYAILQEKWLRKDAGDDEGAGRFGYRSKEAPGRDKPHSPNDMDKRQRKRSWPVRYLVAYLPWLSLLQRYHRELSMHGISREGTTLSAFSFRKGELMSPTKTTHTNSSTSSPGSDNNTPQTV